MGFDVDVAMKSPPPVYTTAALCCPSVKLRTAILAAAGDASRDAVSGCVLASKSVVLGLNKVSIGVWDKLPLPLFLMEAACIWLFFGKLHAAAVETPLASPACALAATPSILGVCNDDIVAFPVVKLICGVLIA